VSLRIDHLSKKYGSSLAVDAISFEAQPGQVLGFLGPNGAGKSTTMKIATGYLAATGGKALVMGKEVSPQNRETKALVGYLPEHNPLYLDMYVREYLAFSGSCYGLKGAFLAKQVEDSIARTGLTSESKKKIGALSKGYRQRVGLAQTLVHNPPVLILDEPTTGLDPNQIIEIRHLIQEIGKEKTVVLSTHIMQEVEAICNRYVIIHKGKIAAQGTVSQEEGGSFFVLEIDREVPAWVLASLDGVGEAVQVGATSYKLHFSEEKQGRASILRFCADEGLDLRGLTRQSQSLEAIFRAATAG